MPILSFSQQPYQAWDIQRGDPLPSVAFEDSGTGKMLCISYADIRAGAYNKGDTIVLVSADYAVMLEGTYLADLFEALMYRSVHVIRSFHAEAFASPAPGVPQVDGFRFIPRKADMTIGEFMHQWLQHDTQLLPLHLC